MKKVIVKNGRIISSLVFIIGVVICIVSILTFIFDNESEVQVGLMETKEYQVDDDGTGTYTIFYEFNDGRSELGENENLDVRIQIKEKGTNQLLKLVPNRGSTYQSNQITGFSVYRVEIDKPGVYEITTDAVDVSDSTMKVTMKKEFASSVILFVIGLIGGSFLLVIGILLVIFTTYLRMKDKRINELIYR